jgi:fibronectin type 3 domain-containing protein
MSGILTTVSIKTLRYSVWVGCLLCPLLLYGQFGKNDTYVVGAGTCTDSSTVKLRWAPVNKKYWKKAAINGYRIARMTVETPDSVYSMEARRNSLVMLDSVVLPLDSLAWGAMIDSLTDAYFQLAYGTLYGDSLLIHGGPDSSFADLRAMDEEEELRYGMHLLASELSYEAAIASGLGYTDTTIMYGYKYLYAIRINGLDSGEQKVMLYITVDTGEESVLPQPAFYSASGMGGNVSLIWRGDEHQFITYEIERSDDLGSQYVVIHEDPILPNALNEAHPDLYLYGDTVSIEDGVYVYRVRGKTVFGDYSAWSDTVHVINKPAPLAIQAYIDSLVKNTDGTVGVYWSFPSEAEEYVAGFRVMRSMDSKHFIDTLNATLLSPTLRVYTDTEPYPTNYYKVQVEDIYGYVMDGWMSFVEFPDSIPPVKPHTPEGVADKQGRVTLWWAPNPDIDICCYRVYYSNIDTGEYHQLTVKAVSDTLFIYTLDLETLQSETYVKIRAIDWRGNLSELSDPGVISLPDVVPPSPPVITRSVALAGMNRLFFTPSSSTDIDHYAIYRRPDVSTPWTQVGTKAHAQTPLNYTDTVVNHNQAYHYVVAAVDASENESYSNIAVLLGPLPDRPPVDMVEIKALNGTGSQASKKVGIAIGWDYDTYPELAGFRIYRSIDEQPYEQYAVYNRNEAMGMYDGTVAGFTVQGDFHFSDLRVQHSRKHGYKVVALYVDGTESPLSDALSLEFYH